jgi:hypothetical protein
MSDRFAGGIMIVSIRRGINLNVQIRIEAFEENYWDLCGPVAPAKARNPSSISSYVSYLSSQKSK